MEANHHEQNPHSRANSAVLISLLSPDAQSGGLIRSWGWRFWHSDCQEMWRHSQLISLGVPRLRGHADISERGSGSLVAKFL